MTGRSATGFYAGLGERIRKLRIRAGLSQAALGALLGRSASAIDRYEMGQRRVALAEFVRLAEILDIPVETLLAPPPEKRRRGTGSTAAREPVDFRAEHLRLLRALDRRLFSPTPPGHGDMLAEDPGEYAGRRTERPVDGSSATTASLTGSRLRRWAREAGLSPTIGARALRRYAIRVLEEAGRGKPVRR